jgi:glycosyltransferase involved in cell wall biosynthesis
MTLSRPPRLTVLMPVLNAMPYLPAAVESLQAQTFRDFIVMAVDDGSTDNSVEYLRSISDPRFRILADGRRRGLGAALNLALAQVTTEFIARMDGDDICPPTRFALQVEYLDQHPAVGAVGTRFTYFGDGGRTGFARRLPLTHEEILCDLNEGALPLIHASLVIRTSMLRAIGGYRLSGVGEDWDMFLRLAEVTRFANLPQLGYYYRLHGRNASSVHHQLTHERVGYARRCAIARRAGRPEPDESAYRQELESAGRLVRWRWQLDSISLAHYYTARNMILNDRPVRGYCYLILGAALGPWRVASRLKARLRQWHACVSGTPASVDSRLPRWKVGRETGRHAR